METIADVLERICAVLGAGPEYDQAVAIIRAWEAQNQARPERQARK